MATLQELLAQRAALDAQIEQTKDSARVEAVAKASRENPDAVLLDVLMRDMNGFQVCRLLTSNESTQHIPIVLVSSKTQQTDRMWGEQQGAKAYITKPYTPDQILQQLRAFESASPTEPGR